MPFLLPTDSGLFSECTLCQSSLATGLRSPQGASCRKEGVGTALWMLPADLVGRSLMWYTQRLLDRRFEEFIEGKGVPYLLFPNLLPPLGLGGSLSQCFGY